MGVSVSLLLGIVACNKGSGLSDNAGLTLMSKINIALGRDSEAADLMSWETCTAYAASAKEKGDYAKARVYFAKAIEKAEKFDPKDPRLPTALRNLAGTYLGEKKAREAEPLMQRVIDIRKKELGASHPDAISSQNELGALYADQGRDAEATELMSWDKCTEYGTKEGKKGDHARARVYFAKSLEKAEKFDPKDLRLPMALNNLAKAYLAENKFDEAEPLMKRRIDIYVKELGPSNSYSTSSKNELGVLYVEQNRNAEASPLLSWDQRTEYGMKAAGAGDYAKARLYFIENLHEAEQFASNDPRLPMAIRYLATAYLAEKKFREAEPLMKRMIDIHMKNWGASHPDVIASKDELGLIYAEQGRDTESMRLLSWDKFIEYGMKAAEAGKYAKARQYLTEAFYKAEKFDPKDSRLMAVMNYLVKVYSAENKFAEAEPFFKRVLTVYEKNHLEDLALASLLNNLGGVYLVQEKFTEAEPFFKRGLEIRSKKLGSTHPESVTAQNNLASLYIVQKRFPEAEKILQDSITIIKKNEGPVPLMINLLENYATVLQALKQDDEAEKIIRQFLRLKNNIPIKNMEIDG